MPRSRRAASKEALKNLQLLSSSAYADDEDDPDTYTVIPVEEMPPKKKYRLSYRKSSADRDVIVLKTVRYGEETLQLDAWPEELTSAQLELHNRTQKEINDMSMHLDQITKQLGAEVIYQGEQTTVFQLGSNPPGLVYPAKAGSQNVVLQSTKGNNPNSYQLVMDARLGLVVGTIVPTTNVPTSQVQAAPQTQKSTISSPTSTRQTRSRRGKLAAPPPSPVVQKTTPPKSTTVQKQGSTKQSQQQSPVVMQTRPAETTAVGGLSAGGGFGRSSATSGVVDLTSDDGRPAADSREISFNKLQGKTFPSLVVVARPHLRVKETGNADRSKLDAKVKTVLMHVHTKFTEWLIQQGLVRSEQSCSVHPNSKLKLGMYSDVSKFPYSGGYVWISECCPQRFVSVFSGSLFEGSPHPPSVILKLIYHWACQTNVQNVVQWVKVDNLYVKGMYTCLRAVCTVALHTHLVPLGGPGKRVEVGVISLGTTSQDGQQRQVKVEVLGLLEPEQKLIRLWSVEPLAEGDRNYKKRFSKILAPLVQWVHPESVIVTDLTVDKSTLHQMGFAHVQQSTSSDLGASNHAIMEYLRRIVPRMFQNTLSLLSRQIIQQFLDELVWREWFGPTPSQAFDSLVMHLSEQTRADTGQALIIRLNKVAVNPFKNWSIVNTLVSSAPAKTVEPAPTPISTAKRSRQRGRQQPTSPAPTTATVTPVVPKLITSAVTSPSVITNASEPNKPPRTLSPDVPEQLVPLENYYYGTMNGNNSEAKGTWLVKCSMCRSYFGNNLKLMSHLFSHAHSVVGNVQQCRYCLSSVATQEGLTKHILTSHPYETKFGEGYVCLICEQRFANSFALGKHMSKEHVPAELPYQCGTCGFRSSCHRTAIDHFYSYHENGSTIQCPFCLKSTTVWSGGRVLPQNLNYFMQHLQKHQKKALAKKCNKCALWFIQKETLKDHQLKMHSSLRRKPGLVPVTSSRNALMVPKSKQDRHAWEQDVELNLSNLTVNAPNVLRCNECKNFVTARQHYKTAETCSGCEYTTCCQFAVKLHKDICKDLKSSLPVHSLPFTMYCICGYKSDEGNMLAKHLAECERKSAYPSEEAAKTAAVTHSMLDVLGLMRRPEERSSLKVDSKSTAEVIDLDDDDSLENSKSVLRKRKVSKEEEEEEETKESINENDSTKNEEENNEVANDQPMEVDSENTSQRKETGNDSEEMSKQEDKIDKDSEEALAENTKDIRNESTENLVEEKISEEVDETVESELTKNSSKTSIDEKPMDVDEEKNSHDKEETGEALMETVEANAKSDEKNTDEEEDKTSKPDNSEESGETEQDQGEGEQTITSSNQEIDNDPKVAENDQ
ncbi:uncharacterized protein LOC108740812 isoform X3 [Agrilus planipennis]|uniref:Uncharacterized protein LOC108740812 isoform X3 n=1 Tax=Agrilus planipennis TaxID=224129 RepID=A0A7F5R9U1_AGRPL|nr:uncharacterized protein LOC108740812 isoform X3 [Agrilus planipennis]